MTDTNISICIPKLTTYFQKKYISSIFENKLNFGKVSHIHICENHDKNTWKCFIYFKYWYDSEDNDDIIQKLNSGSNITVVYNDDFDFWKCYKNKFN